MRLYSILKMYVVFSCREGMGTERRRERKRKRKCDVQKSE